MWKIKMPKFEFISKIWEKRHRERKPTLVGAWRRFVKQVPTDSRALIKTHKHFIVFGGPSSGKTELIQGLIEQSEDLFPFDTTYREESAIQYYFGPKQIIQEIEFPTLENRSIKTRKQVIRLWKKLYQFREPIVVIVQDWTSESQQNAREVNRLAQLIGGKLSLLSEICKKPIKVRIDLTHLDKIEGYLEFARYLKQQDLTFSIPLSTNFKINDLEAQFKKFGDEYLPSMLTTLSCDEFMRIQSFFKEIPKTFSQIEEFLRAIVTRARTKESIDLEMLTFSSNRESSTSFIPFSWKKEPVTAIFFRYPMLKHQVAAASIALALFATTFTFYHKDKTRLELAKRGVDLLRRCEMTKFHAEVMPAFANRLHFEKPNLTNYARPQFFREKRKKMEEKLINQMYKQVLEPSFCNMLQEKETEVRYIYFLGLMYATRHNDVGAHFLENLNSFAFEIGLDPNFIKTYIFLTHTPGYKLATERAQKINPNLALTSLRPWNKFMTYFEQLNTAPLFAGHNFESLRSQAADLLESLNSIAENPAIALASILDDEESFRYAQAGDIEHVQTLSWVFHNKKLKPFLEFVKNTSIEVPDIRGMNISEFFLCIDEIEKLNQNPEQLYRFNIDGRPFSFETKHWSELVVSHVAQRAMQEYIVENTNSFGHIFFANCSEMLSPAMRSFQGSFPTVEKQNPVPAQFSRVAYEKNVRSTAEILLSKIEELPVVADEKVRFHHFLRNEVVSYIKKFQEHYLEQFDACQIEHHSIDEIKKTFKGLLKTTAPFYDFLQNFHYHNAAFSQVTPCLNSFEELNEFEFLGNLFDVENREEALLPYLSVIESVLGELESGRGERLGEEFPFLTPHLSPAANISLQILHEKPNCYRNRILASLEEMGVPERFQAPFFQPIDELYLIGLSELKAIVEELWEMHLNPRVCSLFDKFPFNLNAEREVQLKELEKKLSPQGELWGKVRELISSVCIQKKGEWELRDRKQGQLDRNILNLLSRFTKATDCFWDEEGNMRPLTFNIRPVPFTEKANVNPIPICSYIIVGEKIYRNFNQGSITETLSFNWWEPTKACVGIELLNQNTGVSIHRVHKEAENLWSFFRVLKNGKRDDAHQWTWYFPDSKGGRLHEASIYFEKSLDELFTMKEEE